MEEYQRPDSTKKVYEKTQSDLKMDEVTTYIEDEKSMTCQPWCQRTSKGVS